ncbi:MAG TPA: flavin reductase family protein [Methylomirabilota bacterium]|jgi:flavin reductase (DIM6/NTAB) family NADH-FMN oxidoreductase RutF|nr:flavin reductase family protein [Methylomirabilota bacterium]
MPRAFDDLVFRAALGRFATGVIVLTTGPRRAPHAMTANAFMSGSLEPPLVVVSVGKKARMHARLAGARRFGISILDQAQEPASRHFAGQAVTGFTPAFGELAGVPVLARAAVAIAARIKHRYGCGDHTLYVGEVEKLAVTDPAAPLLFYAGKYALLQTSPEPEGAEPYPSFF